MLKSIFYARFHPEKGSTVLHQVPEGSIIPCPPSLTAQTPLFEYKSVADYIIPRREFCDRLVAICVNKHRIIGFPVCIHDDERYSRNDFIFNFCLVLDEEAPYAAYASVIRKLARLLRNLEEQGQFLSMEEEREDVVLAGEEGYGGGSKVYALCEMVLEDLNNYCECMIPIDESNTVNLKLFPSRAPPPSIHGWHVPLSLVRFESLQVNTWDLTVQRIIPHINGINSVARIASLADTDSTLTRRAIAHLLYYGCICLLDIFQFSAVYAPTPEIAVFFADVNMQDECRRYIASPYSPFGKTSASSTTSAVPESGTSSSSVATALASAPAPAPPSSSAAIASGLGSKATAPAAVRGGSRLNPAKSDLPTTTTGPTTSSPSSTPPSLQIPSRATILELYSTLRQGLSLRDWCLTHSSSLHNIDVRRFITFAKIKGFVYRCHKYAVALRPSDNKLNLNGESEDGTEILDPILKARMAEKSWRKAAMSSGWQTPKHLSGKKGFIEAGDAGLVDANNAVVAAREEGEGRVGTSAGATAGGASVPAIHNGTPADAVATSTNNNNNNIIGGGGIEFTDLAMSRYLDGLHCLDEISTDLQTSEREATRRLKKAARGGEVVFIHR